MAEIVIDDVSKVYADGTIGEEIGMSDVPVPPERQRDPMGRDPCRTPMPWEPGRNGGFTSGEPWLPVGDTETLSVEAQRWDHSSMLSLYRSLIWFRKRSPALRWGAFLSVDTDDEVFAYERVAGDERLLVARNFSERSISLEADTVAATGAVEVSTDPRRALAPISLQPFALGPREGVIVRPNAG